MIDLEKKTMGLINEAMSQVLVGHRREIRRREYV